MTPHQRECASNNRVRDAHEPQVRRRSARGTRGVPAICQPTFAFGEAAASGALGMAHALAAFEQLPTTVEQVRRLRLILGATKAKLVADGVLTVGDGTRPCAFSPRLRAEPSLTPRSVRFQY